MGKEIEQGTIAANDHSHMYQTHDPADDNTTLEIPIHPAMGDEHT